MLYAKILYCTINLDFEKKKLKLDKCTVAHVYLKRLTGKHLVHATDEHIQMRFFVVQLSVSLDILTQSYINSDSGLK